MNLNCPHTKNLRYLVLEVYKALNHIGPQLLWPIFKTKSNSYSLRRGGTMLIPRVYNNFGLNSIAVRAAQAWNQLPAATKSASTLQIFKNITLRGNIYCQCSYCQRNVVYY